MPLIKFHDFFPDYQDSDSGFDIDEFKRFDVYAQDNEKVGNVHDLLVDSEDGRFRYVIVDTGFWIFGKKVLVPIGRTRMNYDDRRVEVLGFSREQVEHLPNFDDLEKVDYDYEEQVRGSYRGAATPGMAAGLSTGTTSDYASTSSMDMPVASNSMTAADGTLRGSSLGTDPMVTPAPSDSLMSDDGTMRGSSLNVDRDATMTTPVDTAVPLDTDMSNRGMSDTGMSTGTTRVDDSVAPMTGAAGTFSYDRDADLYNLNETDHQTLRLFEERLIADKQRRKTGEVSVGKRVETETARVAVPVEREKVILERVPVSDSGTAAVSAADAFQEGEVARVELFEETPDIHKETFVREEVQVKKVVDQDVVDASAELRREELVVNSDDPVIDRQA